MKVGGASLVRKAQGPIQQVAFSVYSRNFVKTQIEGMFSDVWGNVGRYAKNNLGVPNKEFPLVRISTHNTTRFPH